MSGSNDQTRRQEETLNPSFLTLEGRGELGTWRMRVFAAVCHQPPTSGSQGSEFKQLKHENENKKILHKSLQNGS